MKTVDIKTKEKEYKVFIGNTINILKNYIYKNKKILIITDDTVKELHINTLLDNLYNDNVYIFSMGKNAEDSKNLSTYEKCVSYCVNKYLDRDITVIAFGGGAVGDFASFFASTYKRGVRFINIPTTLLAHDSSVGGKTALNFSSIKNMIGTFYQPDVVVYHIEFLKTLPKREIISGFGEILKHDLLSDGYITDELIINEDNLEAVVFNNDLIIEILYRCILVKKVYIECDIYDNLGKRQFLNFGHTVAHAIEILYDYSHGEAVAFGLCFDLYIANNENFIYIYKLFKKLGFFNETHAFNIEKILVLIKNDKKNTDNNIKFIGLKSYGQPYEININEEDFKLQFNNFLSEIK